jgi:cytochrome c oxidase subunit IV
VNDFRSPPSTDHSARAAHGNAWQLWKGPSVAWLALIALFAVNLVCAYVPLGAGNLLLSLVIAALMIAVLSTFLMGLRDSTSLIRLLAGAGLFWTSLMFILTFCDFLSRRY